MNFLLKPEDEMDFLPIMPLNENEHDANEKIDIPAEIALLPLRNTVLFPGVVLPITVGRDKSIKAVTDAYKGAKLIGVIAQKDSTIEDPVFTDLENIGTVAKIVKLIKMPDGGTTIIIQGKSRFAVTNLVTDDPYFKAGIQVLNDEEMPEEPDFEAYVSNIKDLATEIIQLSPNIPSEAAVILRNIENPSFLIHFVSSNLNTEIKEKQRLLEINNIRERADLLMQLLQKELQFAELKNKVTNKTKAELDKQQRDYFLQQQLKSIKEELGGDTNERELKEMQKKADTKKVPVLFRHRPVPFFHILESVLWSSSFQHLSKPSVARPFQKSRFRSLAIASPKRHEHLLTVPGLPAFLQHCPTLHNRHNHDCLK